MIRRFFFSEYFGELHTMLKNRTQVGMATNLPGKEKVIVAINSLLQFE